jgi:hypothetical protein
VLTNALGYLHPLRGAQQANCDSWVGKGGLLISFNLFGALCGFNLVVVPEEWQECLFVLFLAGLPFLRARGTS